VEAQGGPDNNAESNLESPWIPAQAIVEILAPCNFGMSQRH
jgi:hypothetical protein